MFTRSELRILLHTLSNCHLALATAPDTMPIVLSAKHKLEALLAPDKPVEPVKPAEDQPS
ncbi:MAG: hypothetical protein Q8S13_12575 [Dehalococcoidia bacterium]|nr:hypothetical protein [Dehalococcoidia bacterium]